MDNGRRKRASRGAFLIGDAVHAKRNTARTLPPVSAAERDSAASTEKATKARLEEETKVSDLRWLMADTQGRRFVWRLLTEAGVFQSTFTGEALSSAFAEGKRAQGLRLLGEVMQHCPNRFSEMQKEARTHERRNDRSTGSRG